MEIMRNTETQGNLERVFATVLQSLDINQDQRKRYEGVVNTFKVADEPQTRALTKERSKPGSSRQTSEEMHAMNVEDENMECPKCTQFGENECWKHSPFLCSTCNKRGETCPCKRKPKDPKGKTTKWAGSQEQESPMESMLASLQESITGLTQKHANMKKTMATQQEEAPMAHRKQTSFEADEVENHFNVLEIGAASQTEGTLATTALEKELDNSAIAH